MLLAWSAAALSCGPRAPGARPNETLFWQIRSSEISFSQCSDDPAFREGAEPLPYDERSFLVYRVAPDGRTATALSCGSLDVRSCVPTEPAITYEVAGPELYFATDAKTPLGNSGCQLKSTESWLLSDLGEELRAEISTVFALVDAPDACKSIDDALKARSPNGLGYDGCVVRHTLGAALTPAGL